MSKSSIGIVFHDRLFVEAMAAALDEQRFEIAWTVCDAEDEDDDAAMVDAPCDILLIQAPTRAELLETAVERRRSPGCPARVAVLSMGADDLETLELARRCGADACLSPDMSLEAFLECLRLVSLGVQVFPAAVSRAARAPESGIAPCHNGRDRDGVMHDLGGPPLSSREIEIVSALRDGLSNKTIARRLDITESTVKTHLKAILRKIGASNRTQVAIWAVENDLRLPG